MIRLISSVICFAHFFYGPYVIAAHSLTGVWKNLALIVQIDESGNVLTNVGTMPDRLRQFFPKPLYWGSTSPTQGHYVANGHFAVSMGGSGRARVCRFPVLLTAYLDQTTGFLAVTFSNPTGVWLGPDGKCMSQDWQESRMGFARQ